MSRIVVALAVFLALALAFSFAFHNGPLGFVVAVVVVVARPLAYARIEGRSRRSGHTSRWTGYASFYEDDLKGRFPDIRTRRSAGGIGGNGLSKSGGWATPQTKIAGSFHLPWSPIESGRAFVLSGKVPGLGGGLELRLVNGEEPY